MVNINKTVEMIVSRILGFFLVIIAIYKLMHMDLSNFFTISWDLILSMIVIGFGFSFIGHKK